MVGLGMWTIQRCEQTISANCSNRFRFKSKLASPTFTGTVSGIDKTMVGLEMQTTVAMPTNVALTTLVRQLYRNGFRNQ
jgi:hypothetical protein